MAAKKKPIEQAQSSRMMTNLEAREYLADLKKFFVDKVLSSPSNSRKFLAEAGITTPKGDLKKPYK